MRITRIRRTSCSCSTAPTRRWAGGENAANYQNPEFDRLFEKMKDMDNGPERQAVIDEMVKLAREDAPWIYAFHPKSFGLRHGWVKNAKPNLMAHNLLKYRRVDPAARSAYQADGTGRSCGRRW
jgi:oligopeptide transport system substrate-binding protein